MRTHLTLATALTLLTVAQSAGALELNSRLRIPIPFLPSSSSTSSSASSASSAGLTKAVQSVCQMLHDVVAKADGVTPGASEAEQFNSAYDFLAKADALCGALFEEAGVAYGPSPAAKGIGVAGVCGEIYALTVKAGGVTPSETEAQKFNSAYDFLAKADALCGAIKTVSSSSSSSSSVATGAVSGFCAELKALTLKGIALTPTDAESQKFGQTIDFLVKADALCGAAKGGGSSTSTSTGSGPPKLTCVKTGAVEGKPGFCNFLCGGRTVVRNCK